MNHDKLKAVTVYFTPAEYAELKALADDEAVTVSHIVRRKPEADEPENAAKPAELSVSAPSGHSGKVVPKTRPRHSGHGTTRATVAGHSGQADSGHSGQAVGQADASHTGHDGQRVKEPADKDVPAPPHVAGYSWSRNGSGWSLRKRTPEGKRVYVARLGVEALAELKRKHRTAAALERALTEWAAAREADKGIG